MRICAYDSVKSQRCFLCGTKRVTYSKEGNIVNIRINLPNQSAEQCTHYWANHPIPRSATSLFRDFHKQIERAFGREIIAIDDEYIKLISSMVKNASTIADNKQGRKPIIEVEHLRVCSDLYSYVKIRSLNQGVNMAEITRLLAHEIQEGKVMITPSPRDAKHDMNTNIMRCSFDLHKYLKERALKENKTIVQITRLLMREIRDGLHTKTSGA